MKRFILIALLVISADPRPALQTKCDADLINALKTRFSLAKGSTSAQVMMEVACSSQSQSAGIEYKGIGFSAAEVKSACAKKDLAFFQKNFLRMSTQYLPPDAFDLLAKLCSTTGRASLTS